MVNNHGAKGKIFLGEQRPEIEARTLNGESCDIIAEALRTIHGIQVSAKTISRKRVEWGLRKRSKRQETAETLARRAARYNNKPSPFSFKRKRQAQNKEEITMRTQRGEAVEQIADALTAQGVQLNKGVQTVMRLQTFWGLVPPDINKMKGKKTPQQLEDRKAARKADKIARKAAAKEAKERAVPANQPDEIIHYPGNCTAGPGQLSSRSLPYGLTATGDGANDPINIQPGLDDSDDDDWNPLPPIDEDPAPDYHVEQANAQQPHQPQMHRPSQRQVQQLDFSREIMSAELMVDLANSMLMAANGVKDTLVAAEQGRPIVGSRSHMPPGVEDIMLARRKLKEATRCAWDLAKDGILDDV